MSILVASVLQLDKFDLKNLVYDQNGDFLNPRIAIIAKSGSGKSWVIRDILSYLRKIPCGVIIAPTDKMTHFYNDVFLLHLYIMNIKKVLYLDYLIDKKLF